MFDLYALQVAFSKGVFAEDTSEILPFVFPQSHFSIYQHSVITHLKNALADVYPVLKRLLGEACFEGLARRYSHDYPSPSGNLHDFGEQFPLFLRSLAHLGAWPYLADIAQLEWAYHQIFHAAEQAPLALERLQAIAQTDYSNLRFKLHPASYLIESAYPIQAIWEANQADFSNETTIEVNGNPVCLLVYRQDFIIYMQPLPTAEFAFLQQLMQGRSLTDAYAAACASLPEFNLIECLQRWLQQGLIVDLC